ncbi:MAG TPA: PrsW family glutamic-type intramembrane protease [Roseiflexaceae bacterium]|nr:PrsW family glutamic-type intramembrane protease [Roseiflexaceae bacterium]
MTAHVSKAAQERKSVWRSELIAIVGLLVFVAAVVGIDSALRPTLGGAALQLTGIVLALVPAALWLFVFYQQDRLEPEPVGNVARMFVIGLALAGALGIPLTDQVLRVQEWLYRDTLATVLGSAVIGAVQAFVVYATVRYFIFDSPEFDERTDGVVYGTAAALGYATALNIQFILSSGGAALGPGEVFVAEVALAQAAFGGLLGYFLGRAKLDREPAWWLPAGFLVTVVLNGAFHLLRGQVETGSLAVGAESGLPSFAGLLLAGALAVVVTGVVFVLVRRDIARTLRGQGARADDAHVGDRSANALVVGLFALLLLVGVLTWNAATNATTAFSREGVAGAYPAAFGEATAEGEVLRASDPLGTEASFVVRALPAAELKAITTQLASERSEAFLAYKVTSTGAGTVAGKQANTQRFVYVEDGGLTDAAPRVIEGVDYIVVSGDRAVVITMVAPSERIPEVEPLFDRFVASLSF